MLRSLPVLRYDGSIAGVLCKPGGDRVRWLEKEVCGRKIVLFITGCLVLKFIYLLSVLGVFHLLKMTIPPVSRESTPIFAVSFPILLVWYAFGEESLFRLPLAITIEWRWSTTRVLVVALLLSVLFGVMHGSLVHILVQGVGGMFYSVLFLKCGGFQRNYTKAIATTTVTHVFFNAILVATIVARGGMTF